MTSLLDFKKSMSSLPKPEKRASRRWQKAGDIDLVLMDIMLPEMDARHDAAIRQMYSFNNCRSWP